MEKFCKASKQFPKSSEQIHSLPNSLQNFLKKKEAGIKRNNFSQLKHSVPKVVPEKTVENIDTFVFVFFSNPESDKHCVFQQLERKNCSLKNSSFTNLFATLVHVDYLFA